MNIQRHRKFFIRLTQYGEVETEIHQTPEAFLEALRYAFECESTLQTVSIESFGFLPPEPDSPGRSSEDRPFES